MFEKEKASIKYTVEFLKGQHEAQLLIQNEMYGSLTGRFHSIVI